MKLIRNSNTRKTVSLYSWLKRDDWKHLSWGGSLPDIVRITRLQSNLGVSHYIIGRKKEVTRETWSVHVSACAYPHGVNVMTARHTDVYPN